MNLRVLVVDDSATVRAVIAKTLDLARLPIETIHHAADGRQALELLERESVDLLFTDINMPLMDGVELIEAMAERGLLERIPAAIISTEGSTTRIDRLRELGVRAYLRKPFTPESLRAMVEQMLEGRPT